VLGRQTVWQNDGSNNYSLWVAWTLNHLGHAAQLRGDYQRAAEMHQESLAIFRCLVYQYIGLSWAYHSLGETALGMGRLDEATRWLAQGLTISQTLSDQASVPWCLAGLGSVAALDEEPERAARLWGAAERLRQALGCRPAPAARATYERALATCRAQLGEEAFAAAWAEGQAMTLEQAIAEALQTGGMATSSVAAPRLDNHLNRILEVLACLVQCFALGIRTGQLLNPGHKSPIWLFLENCSECVRVRHDAPATSPIRVDPPARGRAGRHCYRFQMPKLPRRRPVGYTRLLDGARSWVYSCDPLVVVIARLNEIDSLVTYDVDQAMLLRDAS